MYDKPSKKAKYNYEDEVNIDSDSSHEDQDETKNNAIGGETKIILKLVPNESKKRGVKSYMISSSPSSASSSSFSSSPNLHQSPSGRTPKLKNKNLDSKTKKSPLIEFDSVNESSNRRRLSSGSSLNGVKKGKASPEYSEGPDGIKYYRPNIPPILEELKTMIVTDLNIKIKSKSKNIPNNIELLETLGSGIQELEEKRNILKMINDCYDEKIRNQINGGEFIQ